MQGNCPNCNATTSTYFGDILTVKGNREKNEVQCGECKAKLQFDANKRQVCSCTVYHAHIVKLCVLETLGRP